jgi:RND family efflux transporter MFP subunit
MRKWVGWLAVVAMLAGGVGAAYIGVTGGVGTSQAAATSQLTAAAQVADVSQSTAATGSVEAATSYALSFGVGAQVVGESGTGVASDRDWTVETLNVGVGDRVTAGQVVATADTADLERELAQVTADQASAELTLREARQTLKGIEADLRTQLTRAERDEDVAQLNLTSADEALDDADGSAARRQARVQVLQARSSLADARQTVAELRAELRSDHPDETIAVGNAEATVADLATQVEDLEQQLANATLVAPADGIVSEVTIVAGMNAPSGDAVVLNGSDLAVVADVVESDISSVSVGQPATVSIDALDLDVPGTVTQIGPAGEASSGSVVTFPVTVTLDDPDDAVRAGMSAGVSITTASAQDVVAVPVAALLGAKGSYVVQVALDDGSTETRQVQVGLVTDTTAEIQSGLAEGEQVVIGTVAQQAAGSGDQAGGFPAGGFPGGGFPGGGFPGGGNFRGGGNN